jgi:hypothetical protein
MATIKSKGKIMATRKTKRYDDGGDVLGKMMGTYPSSYDGPGRDTNGPEPIEREPNMREPMDEPIDRIPRMRPPRDNGIGPRDTGYMDEPPIKSGRYDALGTMAGQLTKAIGGSARGAGEGIPLGQRIGTADDGIPAMGVSDDGIPATNFSDAQTALQNVAAKKAVKDAMVEDMISGMSKKPQVAKIKSSYGGMGGFAKGGSVSKASSRADGIAQRGKTRGTMR